MASMIGFLAIVLFAGLATAHRHAHFHKMKSDEDASAASLAIAVWPVPSEMLLSGPVGMLSRTFAITTTSKSARLQKAIRRYQQWIVPTQSAMSADHNADVVLSKLSIDVTSANENLTNATSYAYAVQVSAEGASITADTVYGAIYGMETFSQLVQDGGVMSSVNITDRPQYAHRGMMIDTGRRFFPPALVMSLLDAMSYFKLNVLHFHLSDLCRFAVQSVVFPELTASSNGFYTQEEIVDIVSYAKDRGIRVIPEFDVPGHSHGFVPLAASGDVTFCSDTMKQLHNDASNRTVTTLKRLFLEMSTLFGDELFHIGCDETGTTSTCPLLQTTTLEKELVSYMHSIGRTPVGWEEILFGSAAASPFTVINTWSRHHASETTSKGYRTVESSGQHFYLNHATLPYTDQWTDIAAGVAQSDMKLLLGGEFSMWSDNYCYITQCLPSKSKPVAYWMYDRSEDAAFTASSTAMIWPRGIVAAGSFWNYQSSLSPTSDVFKATYAAQNARLISRGIASCPNNCTCNELTQCGKSYPHSLDLSEIVYL